MQQPAFDTVVRATSGRPELRRVAQVREWRVERELDSDGIVISVFTEGGESQSFRVASMDAMDIGEVLRGQQGALQD